MTYILKSGRLAFGIETDCEVDAIVKTENLMRSERLSFARLQTPDNRNLEFYEPENKPTTSRATQGR